MHQNTHLDQTRVNKGQPENYKLKIKFKDTEGNIAIHQYPDRDANKWDDNVWITDVNKWRSQTFRRTFRLDPAFVKNPTRTKWTVAEFNFFKHLLKKRVKTTGAKMNLDDFKKISRKHNRRWQGETVRVGEQLLKGTVVKKAQVNGGRSPTALQAVYLRDPDLVNLVQSYIPYDSFSDDNMEVDADGGNQPKSNTENTFEDEGYAEEPTAAEEKMGGVDGGEISDETDTDDDEKKGYYHGGEINANLEEPSEDEYDGMRPASNPTGGVLVPASS